jgi:head-tail adaptor
MTIATLRKLAVLEGASEADTVFGGKTRTWTQVCSLWVDLSPAGHREASEGAQPVLFETARIEARNFNAARPGQRVKAGGEPWRVTAVQAHRPRMGRMTLYLERRWS